MTTLFIKFGLLLIGLIFATFGFLIVFSNQFFKYWNNLHWREKDNKQWSEESIKVNRFGTGLGSLLLGLFIIYLTLFLVEI